MDLIKEHNLSTSALNALERTIIGDFLASAAGDFSDQSCLELGLPATDDYKEIVVAIDSHSEPDEPSDPLVTDESGTQVFTFLDIASAYFADIVRTKPLNAAALDVVGTLLHEFADLHLQWHEDSQDQEANECTLPANDESRALLSAVAQHRFAKRVPAAVKKMIADPSQFAMPDFWIAQYLSVRCKELSKLPADVLPAFPLSGPVDLARSIERLGVAPRFPKVPNYLKSYLMGLEKWEQEFVPQLKQYAAHGEQEAFGWVHASARLRSVHYSLQWYAIQAALGGKARTVKPVPAKARPDVQVAFRTNSEFHQFQTIVRGYNYPNGDADDVAEAEREFDAKDWHIARSLAWEDYTADEIAQAIVALSPKLKRRKAGNGASYAADVAQRAVSDPEIVQGLALAREAVVTNPAFAEYAKGNWLAVWQRSTAYAYWESILSSNDHHQLTVSTIANSLVLGWEDWALNLAALVKHAVEKSGAPHGSGPITFFVLRLLDDWQGTKCGNYPAKAAKDPLYDAVLANWKNPDLELVGHLLLAACDRHTHGCKYQSRDPELEWQEYWYSPYEILMVLYLRQRMGLANPVLEHPLMATPLGVLPPTGPVYVEELLDGVVRQVQLQKAEKSLANPVFIVA